MSIRITVSDNSKELRAKINNMVVNQLAFAASMAVSETAQVVRDNYVLPEYRKTFTSRNKPFEKGVHAVSRASIMYAKKTGVAVATISRRDAPKHPGVTRTTGTRVPTTEFMLRHVKGGIKLPKGQKLAIPVDKVAQRRRVSGRSAGAVVASLQPKALIDKGAFVVGRKGASSSAIVQRTGRGKNKKLETLWVLKPSAQIKKRYNPMPAAERGVSANFERLMRINLVKAIRTAKLRV